jgi:ABC-type transporter MlaC component
MTTEFFTTYLEPILTFIFGGGLSMLLTVRYTRKTAQADAMKAVQDVYQETIKDLRSDKEIIKKENMEMRSQISNLEKTVKQNCSDIRELKSYKCIVMDCKNRKKE